MLVLLSVCKVCVCPVKLPQTQIIFIIWEKKKKYNGFFGRFCGMFLEPERRKGYNCVESLYAVPQYSGGPRERSKEALKWTSDLKKQHS